MKINVWLLRSKSCSRKAIRRSQRLLDIQSQNSKATCIERKSKCAVCFVLFWRSTMKCEQCLNTIEAYIEGELDERTTGFITAHLAGCAACAQVFDELRREQEMFLGFINEVKESPALWSAVRTGIEKEK